MDHPPPRQEALAKRSLLGLGLGLLVIACCLDPMGAAPDSGVLDLGPRGTRWLLGGLGAVLLLGGAWVHFQRNPTHGT